MSMQLAQEFMAPSHIAPERAKGGSVSSATLLGAWKNLNSGTRDLVKVVIAASGTSITVDAFGACSPTPCNWGTVRGIAYASNVSAVPAVAFTAQYTFNFSHVILIGRLADRELLVESFTQFTDGSGRSNLYSADTLIQ